MSKDDNSGPGGTVGRSIVISPDDSSISLAQAIYHHVTTKTERIVEAFHESYVVTENDVNQLCHVLKQVAQRHHEGEWSLVIDHAMFKKSRIRHTSLDRFKVADKSHSDPTSEIVITYDFLCQNPFSPSEGSLASERYKIAVRVSQEPYLALISENDPQPKFLRRFSAIPSIVANIQYVDYTLARALLSAIREWVGGLQTSKRSSLSRFFTRNEFVLAETVPAIFAGSVLLGASGITPNIFELSGKAFFTIFAGAAFAFSVGYLVAEGLANNVYGMQTPTLIRITRGDEKNFEDANRRRTRATGIATFLAVTVFVGVAVNVFSSYIYEWLKS